MTNDSGVIAHIIINDNDLRLSVIVSGVPKKVYLVKDNVGTLVTMFDNLDPDSYVVYRNSQDYLYLESMIADIHKNKASNQ